MMSREIRITIADDEVFDHMKHRKQQLDLSWEEVLRRGLHSHGNHRHGGRHEWWNPHMGHERAAEFGNEIARRVQSHVKDSLEGAIPRDPAPGFEGLLGSLEGAEDATLEFPFLDESSATVPLRVNLRTSADGLDVSVVSIRSGKTVSGTNQFTSEARKTVTEQLARGETAVLRLTGAAEEETYNVSPVLSWNRDSRGQPVVTDVEIEAVRFE